MPIMVPEPAKTYGALVLGGLIATALSGILAMQVALYFNIYRKDSHQLKMLVIVIWALDTCHTVFVCTSIWEYCIVHYGDTSRSDLIPWSVAVTILFTALLTFFVHCFFAHRIWRLSNRKWYLVVPVVILSICRVCAACFSTAEMIHIHRFSGFVQQLPSGMFTLGLALSVVADFLNTVFLCFFLRRHRSEFRSTNHIIDSLTLYTLENGSITCATTIAAMVCWLTMPDNLIFLGLHFVIGKLYANSMVATLNIRKRMRATLLTPMSPMSYSGHQNLTFPVPEKVQNAPRKALLQNKKRVSAGGISNFVPLQIEVQRRGYAKWQASSDTACTSVKSTGCGLDF